MMNFGLWYEAWQACCREHNIDWSELEEERCQKASEKSFYNQDPINRPQDGRQNSQNP